MRIIAGRFKNSHIYTPKDGSITRPTTDRTKEAIFSRLDSWGILDQAQVLDLFAGTGALGFEALSRGAQVLTAVEAHGQVVSCIRRTAGDLLARDGSLNIRIIKKKVELYLAAGPDHSSLQGAGSHKASFLPATVVFMDPPYAVSSQDCSHMVALLAERGWMADDAVLIVERSARSEAVMAPQGWEITDSRLYGETRVDYLGHCRNGV